jgi:hypothetical protein
MKITDKQLKNVKEVLMVIWILSVSAVIGIDVIEKLLK